MREGNNRSRKSLALKECGATRYIFARLHFFTLAFVFMFFFCFFFLFSCLVFSFLSSIIFCIFYLVSPCFFFFLVFVLSLLSEYVLAINTNKTEATICNSSDVLMQNGKEKTSPPPLPTPLAHAEPHPQPLLLHISGNHPLCTQTPHNPPGTPPSTTF